MEPLPSNFERICAVYEDLKRKEYCSAGISKSKRGKRSPEKLMTIARRLAESEEVKKRELIQQKNK